MNDLDGSVPFLPEVVILLMVLSKWLQLLLVCCGLVIAIAVATPAVVALSVPSGVILIVFLSVVPFSLLIKQILIQLQDRNQTVIEVS